MDPVFRSKIEACITAIRRHREKIDAELQTMDALLAEEETPGQIAKRLIVSFCILWTAHYKGQAYLPDWKKDMAIMKRLLKAIGSDEDVYDRMTRYFDSPDPFYANARHPLTLFASAINKFGVGTASDDDTFLVAPPANCRHVPTCKSDQRCTQRKMREMRV